MRKLNTGDKAAVPAETIFAIESAVRNVEHEVQLAASAAQYLAQCIDGGLHDRIEHDKLDGLAACLMVVSLHLSRLPPLAETGTRVRKLIMEGGA